MHPQIYPVLEMPPFFLSSTLHCYEVADDQKDSSMCKVILRIRNYKSSLYSSKLRLMPELLCSSSRCALQWRVCHPVMPRSPGITPLCTQHNTILYVWTALCLPDFLWVIENLQEK